ncbi:MAG TPA: CheR family methyltransferase [Thermoanaerobaculia bacterium]|jgi:two-component system CheB/CheR fusion protein|nr:CheR family methyltransferase [Thermoanaerobaculia bacterium]
MSEATDTTDPEKSKGSPSSFPIVGVGASAGGLEAFLELLRAMPPAPGLAMVYILHHDSRSESTLAQVIQHVTQIPVVRLEGARDLALERDRIYVCDGDTNATMFGGRLRSTPRTPGGPLPIDTFFLSLAEDQRARAIGVILSGSASDGTIGMKMIKSEGGITYAQDDSAQFKSMPESARDAGAVDYVLPPAKIAAELARISQSEYFSQASQQAMRLPEKELGEVFGILEASHDLDFTHYKPSTVERRIRRRMALRRIETLTEYVELLRSNAEEAALLYADILIHVTGFFRDPSVFAAIGKNIAPALLTDRADDDPVRIWVPGCATGEEVYSLAMVFLEAAEELKSPARLQLFGTDVSEVAVDRARFGVYAQNAVADVSPERLARFFKPYNGGYRVDKAVRDCCIFARQNITKDPPFSRVDLISCRNVLIYLGSILQRRVMAIFHYSLRPEAYLILGSSETIGNYGELFSTFDRKHKIYQKKATAVRPVLDFHAAPPRERAERTNLLRDAASPSNVFREADRVLLSRFAPPGVLINEDLEILQFRGRTSAYLEPASGIATFNILKMAREGLLAELRAAIQTAKKTDVAVRRENVRFSTDGASSMVNIEVIPFVTPAKEHCQVILFEDVTVPEEPKTSGGKKKAKGKGREEEPQLVARLKRELEATREYLQSIIEEQEAMNEELRSANEEIQSSNEELQSTNEELETAKEELQSSNEELITLNEELESRNQELAQANNDLVNLLASVDLPIIMLDSDLRIRRFNPGAQRILHLIPTDTGRSISDLKLTLNIDSLDELILDVVENLATREIEVQDRDGRWFSLRVRPYKTAEKKIEGAVLVMIDITSLKQQ